MVLHVHQGGGGVVFLNQRLGGRGLGGKLCSYISGGRSVGAVFLNQGEQSSTFSPHPCKPLPLLPSTYPSHSTSTPVSTSPPTLAPTLPLPSSPTPFLPHSPLPLPLSCHLSCHNSIQSQRFQCTSSSQSLSLWV